MARKRKRTDRRRTIKHKPRIAFPTLRRLYVDACARARQEYPTILGIHECAPRVYRQPPEELFRRFGYENFQQRFWDIDKEDYIEHAQTKGNFSGHVAILSDGQQNRPAVFIMCPADIKNRDDAHAWMMGVLFHELGHVDDISRGLHIRVDTCVDITAAEEHAHRYACKRIIKEAEHVGAYMTEMAPDLRASQRSQWRDCVTQFYRVIMAFYIGEILPRHTELPQESVRQAALRVQESEDMTTFRRFAGSALDDYRL